MITPGLHNFNAYRWATLRKTFIWLPAGTPADLTGYTGRAQWFAPPCVPPGSVSTPPFTGPALLSIDTTSGGIIIDPLLGSVTMRVDDSVLAALPLDAYYYAIQLIEPAGDVLSFVEGVVTLKHSWLK